MRRLLVSCALAIPFAVVACNNGSSGSGSAGGTPSASATTKSTATTTTAVSATATTTAAPVGSGAHVKYSDKYPSRGTKPVTQTAVKGGSGDSRPTGRSSVASEISTDREFRKAATAGTIDCSAKNMDKKAECDQNDFYYCDDNKLWVVNCDAEAKQGGATTGSCYEGEHFIDCLGCGQADDKSTVCCDFQMKVCCSPDGSNCYSPKG